MVSWEWSARESEKTYNLGCTLLPEIQFHCESYKMEEISVSSLQIEPVVFANLSGELDFEMDGACR